MKNSGLRWGKYPWDTIPNGQRFSTAISIYINCVSCADCFDAPIRLAQFVLKTRSSLDLNYTLNFQYSVVLIGSVRTNVILQLVEGFVSRVYRAYM